jgi:hypothetical protein
VYRELRGSIGLRWSLFVLWRYWKIKQASHLLEKYISVLFCVRFVDRAFRYIHVKKQTWGTIDLQFIHSLYLYMFRAY